MGGSKFTITVSPTAMVMGEALGQETIFGVADG
jgi:hypothetical protein